MKKPFSPQTLFPQTFSRQTIFPAIGAAVVLTALSAVSLPVLYASPVGTENKVQVIRLTPQETLRAFLAALLNRDRDRLLQVSIPDKELPLLLKVKPLPPRLVAEYLAQLRKQKIRVLKRGETIIVPPGNKITMDEVWINQNRVQLIIGDAPVPFDLMLHNGVWRVNPKPTIAALKAVRKFDAAQP